MNKLPVLTPTICQRCGHEWYARVPKPIVCPNCKRADWNVIREPKAVEAK